MVQSNCHLSPIIKDHKYKQFKVFTEKLMSQTLLNIYFLSYLHLLNVNMYTNVLCLDDVDPMSLSLDVIANCS